jgi:hypothetical protein
MVAQLHPFSTIFKISWHIKILEILTWNINDIPFIQKVLGRITCDKK